MSRKIRKPQKPKIRNFVAEEVRNPSGPYRPRSEPDRTKTIPRHAKYKGELKNDD